MIKALSLCLAVAVSAAASPSSTAHAETLEAAWPLAKVLVAPIPGAKPSLPVPPAFRAGPAEDGDVQPTLINGKPVPEGTFPEVVRINTGGAGCTATVAGPRIILTAAHCGGTGATSKFTLGGTSYEAKLTRSPLYPRQDHDIALGVTKTPIEGVQPASIGGSAAKDVKLTLLGYGCTQPGGRGGSDGVLRMGETVITSFSGFDMVSSMPDGAALCFGDSGGPAFVEEGGRRLLLGVNSKGNIKDTNWNARLDTEQSLDFLKRFAKDNGVGICGVNLDC